MRSETKMLCVTGKDADTCMGATSGGSPSAQALNRVTSPSLGHSSGSPPSASKYVPPTV